MNPISLRSQEWGILINLSRKPPQNYNLKVKRFNYIYDLKKQGQYVIVNKTINIEGNLENCLNIKVLNQSTVNISIIL